MKIQHKKPLLFKAILVAIAVVMSGSMAVQPRAEAQSSTQGAAETYCNKKYPGKTATGEASNANYSDPATKRQSCIDGWNGADCSDKLIILSDKSQAIQEENVSICQDGAQAAAKAGSNGTPANGDNPKDDSEGTNGSTNNNGSSSGSSGTNSSNSGSSDVLEDMISQLETLQNKKNSVDKSLGDDNKYGSYINGAGKQQAIQVSKAEGNNVPAIIFFNGGGWHTDDGVGQKIASKARERGYTTFVASYRLGSSGVYYMYEDVMRAIRHVRNNAGMYGIDANRIAIWGDSAGGSLAMRAAASGKSGAAAAVGWSAPTNAFTAIFRSVDSFAIGMDHSTCVPTDVNGVANAIDILAGGEGDIATDDGGLGNNGTNGTDTALDTVTQVLQLAQIAQKTSTNVETLSSQLSSGSSSSSSSGTTSESNSSSSSSSSDNSSSSSNSGGASGSSSSSDSSELIQNVRRLTTKKIIECMDNFISASPALFASPLTPPTFLAGFETDPLVGPDQLYQMRDKLRSIGVASSALVLPGEPGRVSEKNHLGYNEDFVAPSLDFLDKFLHPDNGSDS